LSGKTLYILILCLCAMCFCFAILMWCLFDSGLNINFDQEQIQS